MSNSNEAKRTNRLMNLRPPSIISPSSNMGGKKPEQSWKRTKDDPDYNHQESGRRKDPSASKHVNRPSTGKTQPTEPNQIKAIATAWEIEVMAHFTGEQESPVKSTRKERPRWRSMENQERSTCELRLPMQYEKSPAEGHAPRTAEDLKRWRSPTNGRLPQISKNKKATTREERVGSSLVGEHKLS